MPTATVLNEKSEPRTFDYGYARIKELACSARLIPGDGNRSPKSVVDGITIDGRKLRPSKRFWTSIQTRFGFSPNMFRYFDHKEVFDRISDRAPNDKIRYCIERDSAKSESGTLLAVTNPQAANIRYDQLNDLLTRNNADKVTYANGIIRSTHRPRNGASFKIVGDEFLNQYVIDTPIDGFGKPSIYLSILRQICKNGAIGYGKAFRSEIATGKTGEEVGFALIRAMEGFNNEEGYAAMRDRFESAARSWASVNEAQRLYKLLTNLLYAGDLETRGRETEGGEVIETASPVIHNFNRMTGDISEIYGISNLDTLSIKRQRTLPVACKVYDLFNFATEVASHHSKEFGGRKLQAYLGDALSNEYDLEGTVDQFCDYRDFFINDEKAVSTVKLIQDKKEKADRSYGRMRTQS